MRESDVVGSLVVGEDRKVRGVGKRTYEGLLAAVGKELNKKS